MEKNRAVLIVALLVVFGSNLFAAETVKGRFVRAELSGKKRVLTLAEVRVISGGVNVAPKGKATQSSLASGGVPERAMDGNVSTDYNDKGMTHTMPSVSPWWELDLGAEKDISKIEIFNRAYFENRLDGCKIKVLDANRKETWRAEIPKAGMLMEMAIKDYPAGSRNLVKYTKPPVTKEAVAADTESKKKKKKKKSSKGADSQAASVITAEAQLLQAELKDFNAEAIKRGIDDLSKDYPGKFPKAAQWKAKADQLAPAAKELAETAGLDDAGKKQARAILQFKREVLFANPLLDFDKLLVVRRGYSDNKKNRNSINTILASPKIGSHVHTDVGATGFDNEIMVLSSLRNAEPTLEPLFKRDNTAPLRDIDLEFDGDRIMFSSYGANDRWALFEIEAKPGATAKQLTPTDLPDVDFFDACYLPDGRIVTGSTASYQGLPCEGGGRPMACMYQFDPKTGKIRQLTFEQDSDWNPTVMHNGRVMYLRWEYVDMMHYYSRILMSMNPDGSNQVELYGSGSLFPTSFRQARPVPGSSQLVGIMGGHHGPSEWGRLAVIDPRHARKYPFRFRPKTLDWTKESVDEKMIDLIPDLLPKEKTGFVYEIPGFGKEVTGNMRDGMGSQQHAKGLPFFTTPYPLSEKYYLVSLARPGSLDWGIYLVDVFDNMTLIKQLGDSALLEPTPFRPRKRPPVIPDRIDLSKKTATVFITDIYEGSGLKGVPKGTVKKLRLFAYHYAYNKTGGHSVLGVESSWDVKRLLGTVDVEPDGSANFIVPSSTPISIQPLDENGAAVQIMRSWFVGMPGENVACVGCHENQNDATPVKRATAARRAPQPITPWFGPSRPFAFDIEVQSVLDKYCVGCHSTRNPKFKPLQPGLGGMPDFEYKPGKGFSTAYKGLHPYVRRPGPESDMEVLRPMEYHASSSPLVQLLGKNHYNVKLDSESMQRLYTWIDLNAPYYGSWAPKEFRGQDQVERRAELAKLYAGVDDNPQAEYELARQQHEKSGTVKAVKPEKYTPPTDKYPEFRSAIAGQYKPETRTVDLGGGQKIKLVMIPAGSYLMGSLDGYPDEAPRRLAKIKKAFWMAETETTNAQYGQFDPAHDTRYIDEHGKDHATPGFIANHPDQPVARISWQEAEAFCKWLAKKSGLKAALPTEEQWEWAARAGSGERFFFGGLDADFSQYANLADESLRNTGRRWGGGSSMNRKFDYKDADNFPLRDNRFNDGHIQPALVGTFGSSPWGLKDIIGNVCEWTASDYPGGRKVARGGSFDDRPAFTGSATRYAYLPWQKVYNTGFRIIIEE